MTHKQKSGDNRIGQERNISSRRHFLATSAAVGSLAVAGCSSGPSGGGGGSGTDPENIDLSKIVPDGPIGKGPTGAKPQSTSTLDMSEDQISQVRDADMTVSVVFQYLQSDWVRLVRKGLQSQFVDLEANVEGVYGVDFQADKQVEILQTLASKADQLDAIIVYPVDPNAAVEPIRELREKGVEVVIITNTPPNLKHGKDFAGMVTVDNYGLGLIAGRLLREIIGEGQVGMIEMESQLYVIDEREKAVGEVLTEADGIEIVKNSFTDASDTFDITTNMLTANPDMKGLWTPWSSPPGNQAVSALNEQSIDDIIHATVDLNERQAEVMASQGVTKGIAVGNPYGIGQNLVKMAAHAPLGNETPAYASVGTTAIVRENLVEMYQQTLREDPPQSVMQHFEDSE